MQTFLPYPDFQKSLECLDYRRLGKQRVESKQILDCLAGRTSGWVNHPATKMWQGHEDALALYMNMCIDEWSSRGYKNTMFHHPLDHMPEMPPWFGDERLHSSHRSMLLAKLPDHYGQFDWTETPGMPYYWPVAEET